MSEQNPEKVNISDESAETYSLASILAEYKSEAFIRNERRLNKAELEQRADEIIREMKRSVEEELAEESPAPSEPDAAEPAEEAASPREASEEAPAEPADAPPEEEQSAPAATEADALPEETEAEPPQAEEADFLPESREAEEAPAQTEAVFQEVFEQFPEQEEHPLGFAEEEDAPSDDDRKAEKRAIRAEEARRRKQQRLERAEQARQRREEQQREKPEPTPEEALRQTASGISFLRRRMIPAIILCGLMGLLVFLLSTGAELAVLRSGHNAVVILAALQLAVMLLGLDVLGKGLTDLIAVRPGAETVVLITNVAAEVDAVLMISGRHDDLGLPYCITAAASLVFAMWGTVCRRSGFRDTIRAMKLASIPTVITGEDKLAEEGTVLSKKLGTAKGFLRRALAPDLSERVYQKATPAVLIMLLILALASGYLSGSGAVIHCLAALSSAAAALTVTLVYARPFSMIAKRLSGNGAALAGWSGAEVMAKSVGIVIRDLDIYPENTILLNGMKVLAGAHVEKVVAYTGSVILATGAGLRRAFGELMRQYAAPLYRVEDFDCGTEGGVCAFIGTEQVLVGTGAYMNLMGIRIPSGVDVAGAVYTAIDHELCGVFILSYTPQELVQTALYRLETSRLRPIFAVRDFNISPNMLEKKFRLTEGSIQFLPPENRYQLSVEPEEEKEPVALLSREGLWHYSEAARGGRRLWRTARRALFMTILGIVLGVLITFISCARGSFSAISPGKLLLAMLLWAFATLMIADSAEGD